MRDTLKESMEELMAFVKNEPNNITVTKYTLNNIPEYSPQQIKEIRHNTEMTQQVFADLLRVSVRTVEAWEAERSRPNGSARRLIQLIVERPA